MSNNDAIYKAAQKRVKLKKSFYTHLASYLSVGLFLFIVNMTSSPNEPWFHIPMAGWGIGLVLHYVRAFGMPYIGALDTAWEQAEIQKELKKLGRENSKQMLPENHEIDELDLNNRYPFDKELEDLEKWDEYKKEDMTEIRKDFDNRFRE